MIWDIIGGYLGALAYSFIVFNVIYLLLNFITRNKRTKRKNLVPTFALSVVLTLILANVIYSLNMVFMFHLPVLILYFWFEYTRGDCKKCPECAERIKASAKKCKHCHSNLIVNKKEEIA